MTRAQAEHFTSVIEHADSLFLRRASAAGDGER
jgi:hypothetical protein